MSTKFPLEIPADFGMEVICPESAGAAAAGKGESARLCRRAEGLGYCADLCSYVRMGMALAAVTKNGHGLALEHVEVGVLFVIGFHEDPPKM